MTTADKTFLPPIKRFYDHDKAKAELREYNADLTIDLMRQAGLYAWYSAQLVKAESQLDRLEHGHDLLQAKLDSAVRKQASIDGEKTTESQIKSKVLLDPRMQVFKKRVLEAKEEVGYLKGQCIALVQRKDMLIQMGYLARKELEAGGANMTIGKGSARDLHQARIDRMNLDLDLDNDIG